MTSTGKNTDIQYCIFVLILAACLCCSTVMAEPDETPSPLVENQSEPAIMPIPENITPIPTETVNPQINKTPEVSLSPTPVFEEKQTPALMNNIAPSDAPLKVLESMIQAIPDTAVQPSPVLAPVNPAFVYYQQQQQVTQADQSIARSALATQSFSGSPLPMGIKGKVPSPVSLEQNRGQIISFDSGAPHLKGNPAAPAFDLRTQGKVSSVKNQGHVGSCWAFAAYGSLESTLLTGETWDFSENHMKNTLAATFPNGTSNPWGYDRTWDDGGNEFISTAYLTRWTGPVRESDDPYSDTSGVSPGGLKPVKHVQNVYFLPARSTLNDTATIKNALVQYGAVQAGIAFDPLYPLINSSYDPANYTYYNGYWPFTNHAVTIVGWDDTFNQSKFTASPSAMQFREYNITITPAGDGAFIVKNSWGTGWGDGGYFYVSYYDVTIGDECVAVTANDTTNYDHVYSHDPLGWVVTYANVSTAQYANVFTASTAENLNGVGFYTPVSNTNYSVTIYTSPENGPLSTKGASATAAGSFGMPGYHTVTVPNVTIAAGQKFSIVVSTSTPGYNFSIPLEYPYQGYSSHATAHAGESYVNTDGTWSDLTTLTALDPRFANSNVCIKGYALALPSVTSVSPATAYLNNTIDFSITGEQFQMGDDATWINFTYGAGAGLLDNLNITLTSITPTRINGSMVISADMPTGSWNLTVTTQKDGVSPVKEGALNVQTFPVPVVQSVSPVMPWYRNATISYTLSGKNFKSGQTSVYFISQTTGQLLNITELTSVTTTRINGTLVIPHDCIVGNQWRINVSTVDSGGNGTLSAPITVANFPVPGVTSISPVSGYQNSTVTYTISGTNFIPGQTSVYFTNRTGGLLNMTALTSVTTTRINGTIVVPHNAPSGSWNLNVSTIDSGGNGTKLGAFTVNKVLAPTMGALTPATGSRNTTTEFTLTGTNFQTGAGKTSVRVYEDVMDSDLAVTIIEVTATKITGTIIAGAGASPGSYIVEVTTVDGGPVTRAGGFRIVQAAIPTISSMTPSGGYRNGTVAYTVTGTGFQPEKTTIVLKNQTTGAVLGTMTADSVTATKIQGNLTIPVAAPTGYYRLDVTTVDGGVVNRINAFRVDAVKAPTMTSITPATGSKNTTVAFTLTGANFQTDPGQTSVAIVDDTSGTNLAATIYSVTPAKIIGSFTIPAGTPPGKYRLELATTEGGTVIKSDAFTVNYLPLPTISSLMPASGNRGSIVKFTLKGRDFLDGGTFVNLRAPGNAINGVLSSVNSTTIIGNFTIPGAAATGLYRLDVYTVGGGINSRTNAFTVK
ncbi:MAG TPA: hypothetical protein HA272_08645 [Methanoregula sp.]|nr:hypothetical protein [Methanoregula sp.]